jgi:hypothetical protein
MQLGVAYQQYKRADSNGSGSVGVLREWQTTLNAFAGAGYLPQTIR